MQRLVDVLHADGFLAFESNPDHARARLIRLSADGQKAVDALDAIQARWVNGLAEGMAAEQIGVAVAVPRETAARLDR